MSTPFPFGACGQGEEADTVYFVAGDPHARRLDSVARSMQRLYVLAHFSYDCCSRADDARSALDK
jgi:hypothetical protein